MKRIAPNFFNHYAACYAIVHALQHCNSTKKTTTLASRENIMQILINVPYALLKPLVQKRIKKQLEESLKRSGKVRKLNRYY